ncbi:KH domain-containing protein [Candidatus Sumerlaeota bacterium]|nr:KH domain-containing protein [Candidatus Sumerlaeota bacterium]
MTEEEKESSDRSEPAHQDLTLKELIQYIAEALVDFPEEVDVKAIESENSVMLELTVAPKDVGKVIGKGGQTAKAMRKILSAAATKLHKKSLLQIIE